MLRTNEQNDVQLQIYVISLIFKANNFSLIVVNIAVL